MAIKRWEYLVQELIDDSIMDEDTLVLYWDKGSPNFNSEESALDYQGKDGWELTCITKGYEGDKYTFKRELNERMITIKDPRY